LSANQGSRLIVSGQPEQSIFKPLGRPSFPPSSVHCASRGRVVYAASIRSCRPCPLREQCQWNGSATAKPRQVSVLLHPLVVGPQPILWRDWIRRYHRRACIQLLRHQYVKVEVEPPASASLIVKPVPLTRAQRAHYRLSWAERLARNARSRAKGSVSIKLFGISLAFAAFLGLSSV